MVKKIKRVVCLFRILVVVLSLSALGAMAEGSAIAVMYPDMREPYRSIFDDILGGIKREARGKVSTYALKKDADVVDIQSWLSKKKPDAVILLGNRGKAVAEKLNSGLPTVTGAAILSDKNINDGLVGISLAPAPGRLFDKLQELAPKAKRVTVIYHQRTNGWLVDLAAVAAESSGLELVQIPAKDVREAAALYREVLSKQSNSSDAIWLLQGDPTLDERGLLPTILKKAWGNHSIVFSSNPSHVKRGALFSLFPDNEKMGKSLAHKAKQVMEGENKGTEPLQDLLIAVNVRTAEHLNLKISRSVEREFDLVFPNR